MAKLTRVFQKVFGINAGTDERGQIGSLAAGSPVYTTDPVIMQALGNYDNGWADCILGDNSPAIEDQNSLDFLETRQLAYLFQAGVAEWDASTTYYIGSLAQNGTGGIYKSIVDNNTNNILTDTTKWRVNSGVLTTFGDITYMDATPQPARLPGNVTITRKFLRQVGNGTLSGVPAWDGVVATDVSGSTDGLAPASGFIGQELFTAPGVLSIPGSATTTILTLTLSVGKWMVSACIQYAPSGAASFSASLDKLGVTGSTQGRDLITSTIPSSSVGQAVFLPQLVVVATGTATKSVSLTVQNFASTSNSYPVIEAFRIA